MKGKKRIVLAAAIAIVLAAAFWYGGSAPGLQGWSVGDGEAASPPPVQSAGPVETGEVPAGPSSSILEDEPQPSGTGLEQEPEPPSLPEPSEPAETTTHPEGAEAAESGPGEAEPAETLECTISIRCDTILEHLEWLDPAKVELVPADGVILATETVQFEAGETVFDILQRETRAAGIHMEYVATPGYGSIYIEGIANLYEFDCGQQSGWIYLVNGTAPGYGCSSYVLEDGDVIEWRYTCQLGNDVDSEVGGD